MDLSRLSEFKWRKHLPTALMALGLLLLAYVGSQYYLMYGAQRRMAKAWQRQNSTPHSAENPTAVDDGLTRVEIPKINLDAIVIEGSSRKQLKIAPGHITTSAIPGEIGNSVITAHRDTFFRHVYELSKGDEIIVKRNGQVFKFQVTGKKVVDPGDVSVLNPTPDARLTLITCYPPYFVGPAPERLVVFSKLVEQSAGAGVENTSTAETRKRGEKPALTPLQ
jgi:sortase A